MHISLKKGSDKCLACDIALEDDSHTILCDGYDKWICTKCLDMPEPEYLFIKKNLPMCRYLYQLPSM